MEVGVDVDEVSGDRKGSLNTARAVEDGKVESEEAEKASSTSVEKI